MATANDDYSGSIASGLSLLLGKVQNMLQISQAHAEGSANPPSYAMNASIEDPTMGDWTISLGPTSSLNLHGVQLKTIFSKQIDLPEDVHTQITATSTIGNVTCSVDGFIPQPQQNQSMDLILNIKTQDSGQNLPVEQLLALAGFGLESLPVEFPIHPGMLFELPPKSCTLSFQKSSSAGNWTIRLLTFQVTLKSDWVVIPQKIVWLSDGIELHINQDHHIIASGRVSIGQSPPYPATMTVSGDDKDENGTILLSLVQGSVQDIWSALVNSNHSLESGTPGTSQLPPSGSGTLVISCRLSADNKFYEIVEVDFKVPFPPNPALPPAPPVPATPQPSSSSTSSNVVQSTQPVAPVETTSTANRSNPINSPATNAPAAATGSGSTMPHNPATSSAGANVASGVASEQSPAPSNSLPVSDAPFNPPISNQTVSLWNVANQGTWILTSPNQESVVLRTESQTFDPTRPLIQLRPAGIGPLLAERRDFVFSFTLTVNSASKIELPVIDTAFTGSLKASWEPESGSPSIGSLKWYKYGYDLNVAKILINQSQPAMLMFYYAYNSRRKWSLVVFESGTYVTNVDSISEGLSANWSPDPGIAINFTEKASIEVTASNVAVQTNEISGPVS